MFDSVSSRVAFAPGTTVDPAGAASAVLPPVRYHARALAFSTTGPVELLLEHADREDLSDAVPVPAGQVAGAAQGTVPAGASVVLDYRGVGTYLRATAKALDGAPVAVAATWLLGSPRGPKSR